MHSDKCRTRSLFYRLLERGKRVGLHMRGRSLRGQCARHLAGEKQITRCTARSTVLREFPVLVFMACTQVHDKFSLSKSIELEPESDAPTEGESRGGGCTGGRRFKLQSGVRRTLFALVLRGLRHVTVQKSSRITGGRRLRYRCLFFVRRERTLPATPLCK